MASRIAGDLCPSRASRRRQDRLPDRTTSRGPDQAPGFFDALPCPTGQTGTHITSREAHPTKRRTRPAARSMSGPPPPPATTLEHRSDRHVDQPTEDDDPVAVPAASTATSAVPALLIEGVSKSFVVGRKRKPVAAITDVSMRLERGDIHGILGANGSGKSTLIRLISGLLTLDKGRVEVFGHDIEREEMAVKRLINRVSVDAAFFKKLSPMENLMFAARLYGLDGKTATRRRHLDPGPARHRREASRPTRGADEPRDAAEGRDRASPADEPDAPAPGRTDHRPGPAQQARRPDLHRGDQPDP